MNQGDKVLVEAWSLDGGHRIEEHEIVLLSS
jgi:translation initiation factor IF-1